MVERAAHDGSVVGSNPAKPTYSFGLDAQKREKEITEIMNKTQENYQLNFIKTEFKNKGVLMIALAPKAAAKQSSHESPACGSMLSNKILTRASKRVFEKSKLSKYGPLLTCSLVKIRLNSFKQLTSLLNQKKPPKSAEKNLVCIKLKNKIYPLNWVTAISPKTVGGYKSSYISLVSKFKTLPKNTLKFYVNL